MSEILGQILSRQNRSRQNITMTQQQSFGNLIRTLRQQRGEPLRVVAAAIKIDSTLLSKLERGDRFPTEIQIARISKYFDIASEEMTAVVLADKLLAQSASPAIAQRAAKILRERSAAYGKSRK